MDREKVVEGLKHCLSIYIDGLCDGCPYFGKLYQPYMITLQCKEILLRDALALLKEQDERGKAICKEICDFIRGSCSTDTDSDKEYVCHIVNQIFIKGWR